MQELIQQERFEIELLDRLNSLRLIPSLIFTGGTMLRLCYGLERFSVDLDFWVLRRQPYARLFDRLRDYLGQFYTLTDAQNKFHTLLFEIRSPAYPRRLKIEIRKQPKRVGTELAIAYSRFATTQVLVRVPRLPELMDAKITAFLERHEIRDVYDIEFLLRRGVPLPDASATLNRLLRGIEQLPARDYRVKLGSLLPQDLRQYYNRENFKTLRQAIVAKLQAG